jgi:hypothetical protein
MIIAANTASGWPIGYILIKGQGDCSVAMADEEWQVGAEIIENAKRPRGRSDKPPRSDTPIDLAVPR